MDAPPNRGSFNSAHIFGTHVPVEEPSTASKADAHFCACSNVRFADAALLISRRHLYDPEFGFVTYLLKAACKPFWSFTPFCNSSMRRMRAFRADKSSAMTAPASTSVLPPPSQP